MRERVSDARQDLDKREFDAYVSVLESRIKCFMENPCSQVFDHFRTSFVPKVKLPVDIFVTTGLLKYLLERMNVEDEMELSQVYTMLAKIVYLTDGLCELFDEKAVICMASHLRGANKRQAMILLNNILSERVDLVCALIPLMRPCLVDFGVIGVDEVSLSLLTRFAKPLYELDRETFQLYVQNVVTIAGTDVNEKEMVIVMNLLRKCVRMDVRVLDAISLDSILDKITATNMSIVESSLFILVAALETGKIKMIPLDGYVLQVLGFDDDAESIKSLAVSALRFSRQPITRDVLFDVVGRASECGLAVKGEVVKLVAQCLESVLAQMSCDEIVQILQFVTQASLFNKDLASHALSCIELVKRFSGSHIDNYQLLARESHVSELLDQCIQCCDDHEQIALAESLLQDLE